MARKSNIARDLKRQRMINQYAAKRAELKAMGDYEGLAKLPRNSERASSKNRGEATPHRKISQPRRHPIRGERVIPVRRMDPRARARQHAAAKAQRSCVDVELGRLEHHCGVIFKSIPILRQRFRGDPEQRSHSFAFRVVLLALYG